MTAPVDVLVAAVKAHARAHYATGGWDYVVECLEDSDIAEKIAGAGTEAEAIAAMGETVALLHGVGEDVRGAGGCFDEDFVEFPRGEFPPQANVGPLA